MSKNSPDSLSDIAKRRFPGMSLDEITAYYRQQIEQKIAAALYRLPKDKNQLSFTISTDGKIISHCNAGKPFLLVGTNLSLFSNVLDQDLQEQIRTEMLIDAILSLGCNVEDNRPANTQPTEEPKPIHRHAIL